MSSTGGALPERPGPHRPRPVGLARHIRRFRRASLGDSGHSGHSGASGMENPAFRGPKTVFPGRFSVAFRGFPQLWCLSNSNRCKTSRPSRNTVIYDVSEGSQTLRKRRRSTKIDKKSLRQCFVSESRETNMFFSLPDATWRRFWTPRRAPGRRRVSFLASRGHSATSRALPGHAGDAPRCLRDAPEMLPALSVAPWGVPGGSWDRFLLDCGCPGTSPGTHFASISAMSLQASW